MEQKLHTPEGVRDIYNKECETKLALQRKLSKVLHLYGYQDIQTPTFEYYEVFRKEIGSTSTQELYKFFDREGNILALRPDITPSVARAAATLFESEDMPIRLCYAGNTFINHSSYQGRLKENTQLGAELIGLDSVEADAEMLAMVADSLKQIGLQEFQISLGHVDFIRSLLKAAGLGEEESREIRALITNRNFFGIEEILDAHEVKESVREAFRLLPELTGGPEVLEQAMSAAPDLDARLAVTRLQQIFRLLRLYGADDHITFDLSIPASFSARILSAQETRSSGADGMTIFWRSSGKTPRPSVLRSSWTNSWAPSAGRRSLWRPSTAISSSIQKQQRSRQLPLRAASAEKGGTSSW